MGEDGRKKRQFFISRNHGCGKRRRVFELRGNSCGILFTVGSPMRMRDGMHELMALLDDICALPAAEEAKGANSPDEDAATTDVTKALAQELQELKREKARFTPYPDITKGVGYCQFVSLDKNPNDLAYSILRRLEATRGRVSSTKGDVEESATTESAGTTARAADSTRSKKLCCRFLNRLIPVDAACAPHPPNLYRVAQTLIASYFPESEVARAPEQFANDLIRVELSTEQASDQGAGTEGGTLQNRTREEKGVTTQGKVSEAGEDTSQDTVLNADSSQHASDLSVPCEGVSETNHTQPGHLNGTQTVHGGHSSEDVQGREVNTASPTFAFSAPFQVPKGATWCLKFEKRSGMTTIDRDELISKIGAYVGPNYTVNLTSPDFTILVENLPAFCGMSVVRDYVSLCHYNAHRLCFPESYKHNCKDPKTQRTQTSTSSDIEKLSADSTPPADSPATYVASSC